MAKAKTGGFNKFKNSIAGSIIILAVICLIVGLVLALTFDLTKDKLGTGVTPETLEIMTEMVPGSDNFIKVDGEFPEEVSDVYQAENGQGYTVILTTRGNGGPVKFLIGLDANKEFVGVRMMEHAETPGFFERVLAADYVDQFKGATNPDDVDVIAGVTHTSNALKKAVTIAKQAVGQL